MPDTSGTTPPPGKKQRWEAVGSAYEKLADKKGWKNEDGTIFPISRDNLVNYIHHKRNTNKASSVDWWVYSLGKYHNNGDIIMRTRWEKTRGDPDVKKLLKDLKDKEASNACVEKSSPSNVKGKQKGIPLTKHKEIELQDSSIGDHLEKTEESTDTESTFQFEQKNAHDPLYKETKVIITEETIGQSEITDTIPTKLGFKARYETIHASLRQKYVDTCGHHPDGCYPFNNHRHLLLNEVMLRRWAYCIACGDDNVSEDVLPHTVVMPEFWPCFAVEI